MDKARTTPAVTDDKVIVGTQGGILGAALARRCSRSTSSPAHSSGTSVDPHFAAIVTQSPTVFDGKVYVGVASQEEALAAFVPGYVLSFRGSMLASTSRRARSSGRR